ncbi:2OG-Fe(II) oxygenase [Sphingomonas antarctica]|uniref:2OG-Fe(II) oxygenase n=1 Tax=Sphingomonas antarctica TaxID=2040274 RepID=UPI0039EC2575
MAQTQIDRVVTEPVLHMSDADGFLELDRAQARAAGAALHDVYVNAQPYPHIVLDNFIDPAILQRVHAEFPENKPGRFADGYSQLKTGYTLDAIRSAYIHGLFAALNSAPFLVFLEQLTGIKGLTSDPHFLGGGLHETRRGGHLSVHSDFNIHPRSKLQRRLNLILFLNEDWDDDWGGKLELWDRNMARCWHSVSPILGRAVIFNTDARNNHGHPDPLACPENVTRRSIALYYYTAPAGKMVPQTTVFRARPGVNETTTSMMSRLRYSVAQIFGKAEED